MKISRDLAIKILKYLNEHKDFYFPFSVMCREFSEDNDFMEIEPKKWQNIANDDTYQTFELWENLQNLDEETLQLMTKGFLEKIKGEDADDVVLKSTKKYKIEITETLQRVVDVKAKSKNDAIKKIAQQYKDEKIVLGWEDFVGVEFEEIKSRYWVG